MYISRMPMPKLIKSVLYVACLVSVGLIYSWIHVLSGITHTARSSCESQVKDDTSRSSPNTVLSHFMESGELGERQHAMTKLYTAINKTMRADLNNTKHTYPWAQGLPQCQDRTYKTSGLNTSVVISFHENEQLGHVLHTVHSLVQNTPASLLHEIILIDDASKKDDFKEVLQNYLAGVFRGVRILLLRSERPLGLIRARIWGIQRAQGNVVVCMDSHMEVRKLWLHALLHEISLNNRTLATSYLDWMEKDKNGIWEYRHGGSSWRTYFDWTLTFGWQDVSEKERALMRKQDPTLMQAVRSPVMVGGMFAIFRSWFYEVGAYDPGMEGWGGENIDLPIRVWLFGGRVVNVPCSHVAHLEAAGSRDYRSSEQYQLMIKRNMKRVVATWFDEKYMDIVNMYIPGFESVDPGNIAERLALKKRAKHDFHWLLNEITPELGVPDENTFAFGQLQNVGSGMCINKVGWGASMAACSGDAANQGVMWSVMGTLRFDMYIIRTKGGGDLELMVLEATEHYNSAKADRWIHYKGGPITLYPSNMCLESARAGFTALSVRACNATDPYQRWDFGAYTSDYLAAQDGKLKLNPPYDHTIHPNDTYIQDLQAHLHGHRNDRIVAQTVKTWRQSVLEEKARVRAMTGAQALAARKRVEAESKHSS